MLVKEDSNNFASVVLKLGDEKVRFFFVDQAQAVKLTIETQRSEQLKDA